MNGKNARLNALTLAVILSVAGARHAAAQWTAGTYGVLEGDTKHTALALAGISASPKGMGFKPLISLQAFYLTYDAGGVSGRHNVFEVRPAVGAAYDYGRGDFSGTIGYSFANEDAPGFAVATDQGSGTSLSLDWDHWGAGASEPLAYQALYSYNFGTKSTWTRGRVTTRASNTVRIGPEVAYLSGTGYSAWQPGGVIEWHMPKGEVVTIGAGAKILHPGGNAAYAKLEGYLPIGR